MMSHERCDSLRAAHWSVWTARLDGTDATGPDRETKCPLDCNFSVVCLDPGSVALPKMTDQYYVNWSLYELKLI